MTKCNCEDISVVFAPKIVIYTRSILFGTNVFEYKIQCNVCRNMDRLNSSKLEYSVYHDLCYCNRQILSLFEEYNHLLESKGLYHER